MVHQRWWRQCKGLGFVLDFVCFQISNCYVSVVSCASREQGLPVVSEAWLIDSVEKHEAQPLEAYDVVSDLSVEGKGIPWDKQDPSQEAIESLSAEVSISPSR